MSEASWEAELPEEAKRQLAELLDLGDAVPATARPMTITVMPPAPPPPATPELLRNAVEAAAGLVSVRVPERPHPLWLRAGTADVAAAIKSLAAPAGGFKLPYAPRRILEIGAGAGYRSVALANAYPGAEILTTEPDLNLQRVALLNTLPYRNIAAAFLIVSTDQAKYAFTGRKGEPGYPALARDDSGPMAATQLKNFLYGRNWNVLDTVVMTPDAASDHLLRTPWPASMRLLAVETGGAPLHEATAARYPDEKFLTIIEGDYVLLFRREPDLSVPSPPRGFPVFNPDGPMERLALENTSPLSFFPVAGQGFRLHPNGSDAPPARLILTHHLRGYTEFHLSARVVLPTSKPVRFNVTVHADGQDVLNVSEVIAGGESRNIVAKMEPHEGPCEVVFTTEMADFEDSNAGAWAEILAAVFV